MIKHFYNKNRKFWAGLLLAQFLLFYIFSKLNLVINFFDLLFEFQKNIHQKTFYLIPFSIGDIFYILFALILIYHFIIFIIYRKQKHIKIILMLINIVYFMYQIFWGMLYFQEPILNKLSPKQPTIEEAQKLALKYLEICKKEREYTHEDKNGVFKIKDLKKIQQEILNLQDDIPIFSNHKQSNKINNFKGSIFSPIMSYSGILGYYNPFTTEAQYNPNLPSIQLPITLAHESAHQMGYAKEQEANFIGYLIGKYSENIDLRYSTDYFVLKSLLRSLLKRRPKFVRTVLNNYSSKMKKDRLYEMSFARRHEGFFNIFFGTTNNFFLKSNQQEGNITYSYFVNLLIKYERNMK